MMTETQKALLLAFTVVASAIALVVRLAMQRRATEGAASRWRERPTMGDGEFVEECEILDDPLAVEGALAARRVIAELGTVPAETIRPDDSFVHDLVHLPYWDSLEWMGLVLGIEERLGDRANIAEDRFDEAMAAARGRSADLRVMHVVRALAMAAICDPEEMTPGPDPA